MTAFLFPVFDWFARNKWAMWTLFAGLAIFGAKTWIDAEKAKAKAEERKRQYLEQRAKVAEQTAQVETARRETLQETHDAIERADAAADALPEFTGPRELRKRRPDIAGELLGDS